MKKYKFLLSFIFTLIIMLFTNTFWLERIPIDVNLNISGSQAVTICVTLGSSKNDSADIDLKNKRAHTFNISKKGSFKSVIFYINNLKNKSSIEISDVTLINNKIRINDLNDCEIEGAKSNFQNNKLVLYPTSDTISIKYQIPKTYPILKFKFFQFIGLFILSFSLFYTFVINFKNICKFIITNFYNKCSDSFNLCCLSITISITLFLFTLFLLSYLGFIFHIPIQKAYIYISIFINGIFLYWFDRKNYLSKNFVLMQVVLLLLIFIGSLLFANSYYDSSWDGRVYHQEAIISLSNGWNPIFEKPNFENFNPSIWVLHYPKCAEVLSANFVLLFDNLEIGKATNFLFICCVFFLSFFTFNKFKLNTLMSALFSVLIILNPVSICQIKTFYIDFIVYCLFTGVLLSIILKEKEFITNKLFVFLSVAQLAMLCNIKIAGVFDAIILIISYFIYSLLIKKYQNIKLIISIGLMLVVLTTLSGINPYYTNIKQGHHILYPLAGDEKIDIMTCNSPKSFENKSSIYKLFISTFSATKNMIYSTNENPKLKVPFSMKNQSKYNDTPDMRIGGFGYFWGGILLLLIPFLLLAENIKDKAENKIYYFVIITLWLSVLLNPEAWWARYAPQFWLIPIFIIFWKYLPVSTNNKNNKTKFYSVLLLLLLLVNSLIIQIQNNKAAKTFTCERKMFFEEIKNKDVDIYFNDVSEMQTLYYKLVKETNKLNHITEKEYQKNETEFKEVPYLLYCQKNSIGVYKIHE